MHSVQRQFSNRLFRAGCSLFGRAPRLSLVLQSHHSPLPGLLFWCIRLIDYFSWTFCSSWPLRDMTTKKLQEHSDIRFGPERYFWNFSKCCIMKIGTFVRAKQVMLVYVRCYRSSIALNKFSYEMQLMRLWFNVILFLYLNDSPGSMIILQEWQISRRKKTCAISFVYLYIFLEKVKKWQNV